MLFKSLLERFESSLPGNFLDPGLAGFSRNQIQKEHPERGAAHRGQDIEGPAVVIPRYDGHYQQIIAERQKQERRIHHPHDEGAEVVEVEQKPQQRPKK